MRYALPAATIAALVFVATPALGELRILKSNGEEAVPAEATLTLAGSKTISKGPQRRFTTQQLAAGQVWSGYTIVASVERNGQTLTKEQTIDLKGGETRELTFDFNLDQVASR